MGAIMKSSMSLKLKVSLALYIIFIVFSLGFSFAYLIRAEFMPYHAAAIGMNWSELDPAFKDLILGLMKATGAGWLSAVIAMSILLVIPFRNGETWSYWAIPLIPLPALLVNIYVATNMLLHSPAKPPWQVLVLNTALLLLAFVLSMTARTNVNVSTEEK